MSIFFTYDSKTIGDIFEPDISEAAGDFRNQT